MCKVLLAIYFYRSAMQDVMLYLHIFFYTKETSSKHQHYECFPRAQSEGAMPCVPIRVLRSIIFSAFGGALSLLNGRCTAPLFMVKLNGATKAACHIT
jgi:hypothetical protein